MAILNFTLSAGLCWNMLAIAGVTSIPLMQDSQDERQVATASVPVEQSKEGLKGTSAPTVSVIVTGDGKEPTAIAAGVLTIESPDGELLRSALRGNVEGSVTVELQSDAGESQSGATASSPEEKSRSRMKGKIVVTGPDGQRREYDFDGELPIPGVPGRVLRPSGQSPQRSSPDSEAQDPETDAEAAADSSESRIEERWVIGVQCEEASELLRMHLKLGEAGLVVLQVREDTPAAEAGLQIHDIIVRADDRELSTREDLIDAVTGSQGKSQTLEIVRAGDRQEITVTPRKLRVPVIVTSVIDMENAGSPALSNGVWLQRIHPGVIVDGNTITHPRDLEKLLERVRSVGGQDAERRAQLLRELAVQSARDVQVRGNDAELRKTVKDLQDRIQVLEKQLQALQSSSTVPKEN